MFTALFVQHYGETDYVMPFVLWYSFQRAGLFFMSCLGTVANPYRICVCELVLALLGCLCTLLGASDPMWWNAGAVLVGLGLSGFAAIWRTVRDDVQRGGTLDFGGSMTSGYAIFLSGMAIVLVLGAESLAAALAFLMVLLLASLCYVAWLHDRSPYGDAPMLDGARGPRESVPFAASVLALTLCVRLFRQTASMWIAALLPAALMLMLVLDAPHRTVPYRAHSRRTLWYGAMTNFLYVFSLLYLTSIGDASRLGLVYFAIGTGSAVATLAAPIIKRALAPNHFEAWCIAGALVASCCLLVPWLYVVGTALVSMFVTMGSAASFAAYLEDERIAPEERRLVRSKFFGIGSVIEQAEMALAISACSWMVRRDASAAMAGYAIREVSALNLPVYRQALAVCVALNALAGMWVARTPSSK